MGGQTLSCSVKEKHFICFFPADVCQYRLDYQTFSTMVSADGACTDPDDGLSFTTPAAVEPPTICGTNTGLHSEFVRLRLKEEEDRSFFFYPGFIFYRIEN